MKRESLKARFRTICLFAVFIAVNLCAGAMDRPDCPDQAAALLARVDPLVSDFKEEAVVADRTPRISLAPEISRLRAIHRETVRLAEWPEESCGLSLRDKLDQAERYLIQRLEAFMADGRKDPDETRRLHELWNDAERQLKALRELVEATRRS